MPAARINFGVHSYSNLMQYRNVIMKYSCIHITKSVYYSTVEFSY